MSNDGVSKRIGPRSVRERCKGRVDDQVLFCLMALAEDLLEQRKEIVEMAQAMDALASVVNTITAVNVEMKKKIEGMRQEDLDDITSPYVSAVPPEEQN